MKKRVIGLAILAVFCVCGLSAQTTRQFGVIRGIVTDDNGEPLPGVSVVATSPALMGSASSVTGEAGAYRCVNLPPGEYAVTAELSGFKTVRTEGINVRVGMTLSVDFRMDPAAISEEVTVIAASPLIDTQSQKITTRIDSQTLQNLPLGRSFRSIIEMTPGMTSSPATDKMSGMGSGIIRGGTAYGQTFEVDGQNVVDPAHGGAILYSPQYDTIEEISIETGGLEAQVGNSGGNFINVVTKSGGNQFRGTVSTYYTQQSLTEVLFSDEHIKAMKLVRPSTPIFDYDLSLSLGGPIIKDKIWFFSNVAYENEKNSSLFIPGFVGGRWVEEDNPRTQKYTDSMLKISTALSNSLRFFLMGSFSDSDRPASGGTRAVRAASHDYIDNRRTTINGQASWIISGNSFLDVRAGLSHFDYPISYPTEEAGYISYQDTYTGYTWGGHRDWASEIVRSMMTTSARFTHFQDNFLGGNHEIGLGVEFQRGKELWWQYDYDPMHWYYYNDNPYYYRGLYNRDSAHPTFGDGRLRFVPWGTTPGDTGAPSIVHKLGTYFQDSWNIQKRLYVTLGLRYDYAKGFVTDAKKGRSGGIAYEVGAQAIEPTYGFNPFGELTTPDWDAMQWNVLSPRIGLSYDIFGNGKSVAKASFARYADNMPAMYFQGNHPFSNSQWGANPLMFYWWDVNGNGIPDAPPIDTFQLYSGAVSDYDPDPATYTIKIDPDIYAPTYNEFILGFDQEVVTNFRIGVKGFYREKKGALDNVLYDRASNRLWYTYEQAPEWYVPFQTIVPGIDEFGDQEVTFYLISRDAPWQDRFYLFTNVPESLRRYSSMELTFDKRAANGWALGGSVVLSRLWSNVSGGGGTAHGFSASFNDANYMVNREGLDADHRGLEIKLYGFFNLPLDFVGSFIFNHYSGSPWQRTVTVSAPTAWANANNAWPLSATVNVEPQGSRREPMRMANVDFRLEKKFRVVNFGELGLNVDVFNLLGNRYTSVQYNPAGTWFPDGPNTNQGRFVPQARYGTITGISGTRIYKVSARFSF